MPLNYRNFIFFWTKISPQNALNTVLIWDWISKIFGGGRGQTKSATVRFFPACAMCEKRCRAGPDMDSFMNILTPIAQGLLNEQVDYPLTITYIPLKWCGFAYKIF